MWTSVISCTLSKVPVFGWLLFAQNFKAPVTNWPLNTKAEMYKPSFWIWNICLYISEAKSCSGIPMSTGTSVILLLLHFKCKDIGLLSWSCLLGIELYIYSFLWKTHARGPHTHWIKDLLSLGSLCSVCNVYLSYLFFQKILWTREGSDWGRSKSRWVGIWGLVRTSL